MLFTPIYNSIYPHMVVKKDMKLIKTVLAVMMPLIISVATLVIIFADPFIELISGEGYGGAVPIFRILVLVLVTAFPANLIGFPVFGAIGKEKYVTFSTLISAAFHVVSLSLLFITGIFSVYSMAIARVCTEVVMLVCRMIYLSKNKNELI